MVYLAGSPRGSGWRNAGVYSQQRVAAQLMNITILCKFRDEFRDMLIIQVDRFIFIKFVEFSQVNTYSLVP